MSIKKKICEFLMSNKKLYDSKVTGKHWPCALPIPGKPCGAIAPEKDAIMKNCGYRICGMHPCKPVTRTNSSTEIIVDQEDNTKER